MNLRNHIVAIIDSFRAVLPYLYSRSARYRVCTEEYPDRISARVAEDLAPRSRGFLKNDLNACTGCGECISLCPSKALDMDADIRVDGTVKVNRFRIDLGRCFSCSACVEICPVESLQHTRRYEINAFTPDSLVITFSGLGDAPVGRAVKIRDKIKMIRSYEVRR